MNCLHVAWRRLKKTNMKVPDSIRGLIEELRGLGFNVTTWERRSGFIVIWRKGSQGCNIAAVDKNNARLGMTIEMLKHEIERCKEIDKAND